LEPGPDFSFISFIILQRAPIVVKHLFFSRIGIPPDFSPPTILPMFPKELF